MVQDKGKEYCPIGKRSSTVLQDYLPIYPYQSIYCQFFLPFVNITKYTHQKFNRTEAVFHFSQISLISAKIFPQHDLADPI